MIFFASHYDYAKWLLPFKTLSFSVFLQLRQQLTAFFAPDLVVWHIIWKWTNGNSLAVLQDSRILYPFIMNRWRETFPINLDFLRAVVKNHRKSDFPLMLNKLVLPTQENTFLYSHWLRLSKLTSESIIQVLLLLLFFKKEHFRKDFMFVILLSIPLISSVSNHLEGSLNQIPLQS